jgi:hypothetical protein
MDALQDAALAGAVRAERRRLARLHALLIPGAPCMPCSSPRMPPGGRALPHPARCMADAALAGHSRTAQPPPGGPGRASNPPAPLRPACRCREGSLSAQRAGRVYGKVGEGSARRDRVLAPRAQAAPR